MVLDISLTKNYSTECMVRKESEHIQGRTNRRRLVFYPTIQLVIVNQYTKYELSVLYSCGDIFDEKYGEKEKRTNTGKNKQEKAHFQSPIQLVNVNLYTKYEVSILNSFGDIFDEKVLRNYGRMDGRMDRCKPVYSPPFSKQGYNSITIVIQTARYQH